VLPGRQDIPIWLTILIGMSPTMMALMISPSTLSQDSGPRFVSAGRRCGKIVAALIGSLIASALGVGETRGIDWIKLIIQVALAAAGVALVAGRYAPGRRGL
jgi:hypothetical protein